MPKRNPFKRHRFTPEVIFLAVRWYCRYPLSYRDVRDLLAERGIQVDPGKINRWVVKFGPEIAKRSFKHCSWRGLTWHVDETHIRVGGQWRFLWRAVDHRGQLVDFRLTARRNAKATLKGVETIRTIKRGHVHGRSDGIAGEISFVNGLFGLAA